MWNFNFLLSRRCIFLIFFYLKDVLIVFNNQYRVIKSLNVYKSKELSPIFLFLVKLSYQKWFFFQYYSFWLILFKYPYCNRIVIVKVITITGCFAMYSITITITCNHKNQRLQITFQLLKTCNRLHVITITDYNYNRSDYGRIFKAIA